MNRALRLLSSEARGLQRAVYILAVFNLLSSVLALLRERIFAHVFGAGNVLDVYNAAFRIPDFLFIALGALVSVYVLIPEVTKRTDAEQHSYLDTIVVGFSLLAIVVCGVAAVFAPFLLPLIFPKLVARGLAAPLTLMTRIMLLQPVLLGFSNIFAAITQSRHRYLLYASSQIVYNFGIILGAVILYPLFGMAGLAWGVVIGAVFHAGIQLPSVIADGFFNRVPKLREPYALVRTIYTSIPRALALSMSEVAELGLVWLAGLLAPGSIAIFFFAYNLQSVPVSIIGSSYSVAAFPGFAAARAKGQAELFIQHMADAARAIVFWSLPATALMIVLRAHIVRVILGSGRFTWNDTRLTAAAFALFGISLAAQSITMLIVRAYYASGRSFVPFLVATVTALATILFGAASIGALHIGLISRTADTLLRVADVPGADVLALAFAYALVSVLGALVFIVHFEYRFGGFMNRVLAGWTQSFAAAVVGGVFAWSALQVLGPITLSSTLLNVFLHGAIAGVFGIAGSALAYALLKNPEYEAALAALRGKLGPLKLNLRGVASGSAEERT